MFKHTAIGAAAALAAGGLLLAAGAAKAQDGGQRIEITGSSIKRIDVETALPVTVLKREDIERSGATTAAELLDKLSANNGQGYNMSLAIGDSARPGFSGASLRGLGSNTTLVLLNGRRLAVYAFDGGAVDLNSIALGAVERVEILRDGASAVYGTDAIAGVINFITRRDFTGGELAVSARLPQATGGKSTHASVTFGLGDPAKSGFNVFGNLTYDKQDNLRARDREFAKTAFLPNAEGGRIDRTSGNTFPASIFVPGVGTVNPGGSTCAPPNSFLTTPGGACRFDYASVIDIIAPQERIGGLVRGTLNLGPNTELFAEFNKVRTESIFRISPTPASSGTTFNGDPVLYPAGGRWYPRAVNPATGQQENGLITAAGVFVPLSGDLDLSWRTVEGGARTNKSVADQDRIVLGAKGSFGNWDYDTAYMRSRSKATESYVEGYFYETKLLNSVGTPTAPGYAVGTLNPDINPFGPNDAAGLAAIRSAFVTGPVRIAEAVRQSVDGKISGELMQLPAGPLSVAFGGERRTERYTDNPLAVLGSGDIIGGGGNQLPVAGKRTVSAVFAEASAPIFKGFEALFQLRHDRYSDFGKTTNPKLGLRWQPMSSLLVRASTGTGFRAPTLPDLLAPVTQTNTGDSYNDPYYEAKVGDCYNADGTQSVNFRTAFCNAQLTVNQGGNPQLGPEKSRQSSIGLVFQPTKDISVSVDLWRIRIKDQIAIADADATLADFIAQYLQNPNVAYDPTTARLSAAGKAALAANATAQGITIDTTNGFLNAVSAQFQNLATTSTSGLDLSVNAVLARTSMGVFRLGVDATYIDSQNQNGTEVVGTFSTFGPVVRLKSAYTLGWEQGGWSANATYRWQSSYLDQGATRKVAPYETLDLGLEYRGIKNLTLVAQVINLLDKDPPFSRQGTYFHVGYDPTYTDPRGRTFVLAARYKF